MSEIKSDIFRRQRYRFIQMAGSMAFTYPHGEFKEKVSVILK